MWPDRVSKPGPLTYKSRALPKRYAARLNPMSKNYNYQLSKQECLQIYITLFLEKRQRAFIRAGKFLGLEIGNALTTTII